MKNKLEVALELNYLEFGYLIGVLLSTGSFESLPTSLKSKISLALIEAYTPKEEPDAQG